MPARLKVNPSQVVHETIDGETILIHLGTGTYYSLDGVAGEVWAAVLDELSGAEIVAGALEAYDADAALVEGTVAGFVRELILEGLVAEEEGSHDDARVRTFSPTGAFSPPVLHKYTDMQEFMLVDPIHDVEAAAGWPHVKAD
ncbi:MAG: PqqD family protein [Solirubrobacteraceae bacterium]